MSVQRIGAVLGASALLFALSTGALSSEAAPPQTLTGGSDPIVDLALSPDGSMLAGVTEEGAVLVWSVQDGAAKTLVADGNARSAQFLSSAGNEPRLLVGTSGEVSVWDPTTGAGVAAFPLGRGSDRPLIASKDGARIAVSANSGYIFYDVATQKSLHEIAVEDAFTPIALGPKGEFAAIGDDSQIRLVDLKAGTELAPIRQLPERARLLAIHPNGRVLAVGLTNETQFWDIGRLPQPPKLLLRQPGLDATGNLEFIANGKLLAGTGASEPQIWDAATKAMRPEIDGSREAVVASEDGSVLVMQASGDRTIVVDGVRHRVQTVLEANVPPGKTQYEAGASGAYAVSDDGNTIFIGLKTGSVEVRSSRGETPVEEIASYEVSSRFARLESRKVEFLPGGDRLLYGCEFDSAIIDFRSGAVTALENPVARRPMGIETFFVGQAEGRLVVPSGDGGLYKFDLASGAGQAIQTSRKFFGVGASPDGMTVVAVTATPPNREGRLLLLDAATGEAKGEPLATGTETSVRTLFAFSADGSKLATCIFRKTQLWDLGTRQEIPLDADGDWRRMFLIDEGRTLALIGSGVLRLIDTETAQLKTEIKLATFHTVGAADAAVSPTDPIFASVGDAGEVLLRDLTTGQVLGRAIGHEKTVRAVSFDAEGKRLATVEDGSEPGRGTRPGDPAPFVRIKVWAIDAAKLRAASRGEVASAAPKADPGAPNPSPKTLAEPTKLAEFECLINGYDYPRMWFSPDRKLLLAGTGGSTYAGDVQGFDLTTGESKFTLENSTGSEIVFSPDGKFGFTYAGSRTAYSIDLATGQMHGTDSEHCVATRSAIASTDDESFIVGLKSEESMPVAEPALLKLDRTDPTKVLAQWDIRAGSVRDIAQLPDGTLLVSLSERGEKAKVLFFDPDSFEVVGRLYEGKGHYGPELTVAPDRKLVIFDNSAVWTVDREAPRLLADESALPYSSGCLGFVAGDGLSIHANLSNGQYHLFDPVTRTVRRSITFEEIAGGDRSSSKFAVSPDGRLMAWGTSEGEVVILDLVSGVNHPPKKLHDDKVYAVSFSPNGDRMATACLDGKIAVWSLDGSRGIPVSD